MSATYTNCLVINNENKFKLYIDNIVKVFTLYELSY